MTLLAIAESIDAAMPSDVKKGLSAAKQGLDYAAPIVSSAAKQASTVAAPIVKQVSSSRA